MSWSEQTQFTLKGDKKDIDEIKKALRSAEIINTKLEDALATNEFLYRLGILTQEEALDTQERAIPTKGCGSSYIDEIDSSKDSVVSFELVTVKNVFTSEFFKHLKKKFPTLKIYFLLVDELWMLNDFDNYKPVTNDINGHYYPTYRDNKTHSEQNYEYASETFIEY